MARLFRNELERKKGLWRRVVDLALTDVHVVAGGRANATLEALEERLLAADFGVSVTMRLVARAEEALRRGKARGGAQLVETLQGEIRAILESGHDVFLRAADSGPTVYLMVGVNGVGKTTSVAKLANFLKREGRTVMVVAADTFRAGAVEQLEMWAARIGADFVRGEQGGDPAAVAFDACQAAVARGSDVVFIDTAGRLHTQGNLMSELEKIRRVTQKVVPGGPHEVLLVLDSTTGQNGLRQAEEFLRSAGVTGLVLSKLDGTARGGIALTIARRVGLPIRFVGTGERDSDLAEFDATEYVDGLLGTEATN